MQDINTLKARLIEMIEYAEALENVIYEKQLIESSELREYFDMPDDKFLTGELL
jgi:hypothetical protein